MSSPQTIQAKRGIVKQVLSGDTIVIRGQPLNGPPPELTVILANVLAPKMARKSNNNSDETKDEPYAWEAREFLRKKLIGQEVVCHSDKSLANNKVYGTVWLGKDPANGENVAETLISEGLISVKRDSRNPSAELLRLQELEDVAKSAKKGKWSGAPLSEHVRTVTWTHENPNALLDKYGGKPVKAVIEHVRDGSTVRAFLLPNFDYVTVMISGIRCPGFKLDTNGMPDPSATEPFAEEAKYFVESRILQRDVEIIIESVNNNNFVGSVIHPKGNIAQLLLSEGFAKCVDWSMRNIKYGGTEKLYKAAEKAAREKRLRRWKDYVPIQVQCSEEFNATVMEIVSADSIVVKTANGDTRKIFLSSIRAPSRKQKPDADGKPAPRPKDFRPLYEIPYMFEAREFLRKKLIKKPVKVFVDYVQPPRDNFPEKVCCTVIVGKINIADALVSKGLATVIRYRQNDDQRSSHYEDLQNAEKKAEKSQHGLWAKKEVPAHRVRDISNDPTAAKAQLSGLKRALGTKAIVEFVTSGARLKLYVPKECCLITFLLAGVKCPRAPRITPGGTGNTEGEPHGEEALNFTKDLCQQKDVEINVETMESKGSAFIGTLTVDGVNLAVALVEQGLAEVSMFIEQGEHYKTLKAAEDRAKASKLNIWKDRVVVETAVKQVEEEEKNARPGSYERKIDYKEIAVSSITELQFFAQKVEQRDQLESLLTGLRQELQNNPPLPGAYTPKRGELAVAKFSDDQWYRVKIEKILPGNKVSLFYIDYGNRETQSLESCRISAIPPGFIDAKPFATEYQLACVKLPEDSEEKIAAIEALHADLADRTLLMNVEYYVSTGLPAATLVDSTTKDDIVKALISEGFLLVDNNRDRRAAKLIAEYQAAEDEARMNRMNIWRYGDIRKDDAKEFGVGGR